MKKTIAMVLCLMLTLSFVGCGNKNQNSDTHDANYEEGYTAGYEAGYNDGKQTSLDKGTQRKTTENELPSLTQCTA